MGNWLFPGKLTQVEKTMRIICVVLLLTCLQPLIFFFSFFQYSLLLIPVIKMAVVILLWLGKRVGWIGFVTLLTFGILSQALSLFTLLKQFSTSPDLLPLCLYFLAYIGTLIYICLPQVRETYRVRKIWIVYATLTGLLLFGIYIGYILYALNEVF